MGSGVCAGVTVAASGGSGGQGESAFRVESGDVRVLHLPLCARAASHTHSPPPHSPPIAATLRARPRQGLRDGRAGGGVPRRAGGNRGRVSHQRVHGRRALPPLARGHTHTRAHTRKPHLACVSGRRDLPFRGGARRRVKRAERVSKKTQLPPFFARPFRSLLPSRPPWRKTCRRSRASACWCVGLGWREREGEPADLDVARTARHWSVAGPPGSPPPSLPLSSFHTLRPTCWAPPGPRAAPTGASCSSTPAPRASRAPRPAWRTPWTPACRVSVCGDGGKRRSACRRRPRGRCLFFLTFFSHLFLFSRRRRSAQARACPHPRRRLFHHFRHRVGGPRGGGLGRCG